MKTLLVALLFCQVVVKSYSLSRFEDVTAAKLTELKREWKEVEESNSKLTAKLAELFDEGEKGSGVEPGPGPLEEEELKALHEIVDALRKHIIPTVVKASKQRDEESKEYAGKLVELLKGDADREELKQALGKTVIEMHGKCDKIQAGFLKLANESGLLSHLKEKLGSDEEENELEKIKELLESDEENDFFEALEKMGSKGKSANQALKAFIIINKLFSKATCGNPANALVDRIDERISGEDPADPFPDLSDRIISLLGLGDIKPPKACKKRKALVEKNDQTPDSPKEKMLKLFLQAPKDILCKDVPVAKRYLDIIMKANELGKKIGFLKTVDTAEQFARIKKIKNLIGQGRYAEAAMLVGETALEDLRKGLLIGLTVKKTKRLPKLKPTLPLPFKPKGPKELFDLDNMMSARRQ